MVRSDTSAATLRQEVSGMACAVWITCSRAVRGMQDAVVSQLGHVPRLQQAEGREARRVQSQTAAWPQHRRLSSGDAAHLVNYPKGAAQALALAGSSWHRQRHRRCLKNVSASWKARCKGGGSDEASSALGTEDGPSAGPISSLSNLERRRCRRCRRPRRSKRSRR